MQNWKFTFEQQGCQLCEQKRSTSNQNLKKKDHLNV
jgi:hypothetical protein